MGIRKRWKLIALVGLLIGIACWWVIYEVKNQSDPLNKSDAFVYSEDGILYWFELTSRNGKVKGTFYQHVLIEDEDVRDLPHIEEKQSPLTGEFTDTGYEWQTNEGGKIVTYVATLSEENLLIHKQGEEDSKLYRAVNKEKLAEYEMTIHEALQIAIDQNEEKEKSRLRKFFSEFNNVYGYYYTNDDKSLQLLIKVDEANLEGDVTATLLMTTKDNHKSYEEKTYELNGITDGHMVEFYTVVDGMQTKLKGDFRTATTGFDLSFWTTNETLFFRAVTEKEMKGIFGE